MNSVKSLAALAPKVIRSQLTRVFFTRASGLFLSIITTSLAAQLLLPEKFGQYTLIISLVTILSVPSTMGLKTLVARETAYSKQVKDEQRGTAVWVWAMRVSLSIAAVVAIALLAFGFLVAANSDTKWQFAIGAVLLMLSPVAKILSGVLHGLGMVTTSQVVDVVARPLFMSSLLLGGMLLFEPGTPQVVLILGFMVVSIAAEAGVGAAFLGRREVAKVFLRNGWIENDEKRQFLIAAISFGAISGVQVINGNLDILMIAAFLDPTETGLYRTATSLAGITSFGLVVVNLVILPKIAALHKSGDRDALQLLLFRSVILITLSALLGSVFLLVAGTHLLDLLFGEIYTDAYWSLAILAGGQFCNAFFGPVALLLNMTGREKLTLVGVSVAALVNAALNIVLVPRYGIEGAAFATAFSLFLWNVSLAIILKATTGLNPTVLNWKLRNEDT